MCGKTGYWAAIADEMGETTEAVKTHLNALANRRNKIVHEGDIQRQSKPREVKHNPIEAAEIRDELSWVRRFINAVGKVAP